jgi:hypothetical protein
MKLRGASTPADGTNSTTAIGSRGKGGLNTVGSPAARTQINPGAVTAVSIEREVVSGHAYAILAPDAADGGRCGYDNPTNLSVDGVFP